MKKRFYVDSCIWLNLFKKEGDASKGKPYWEIAEEFIEDVMSSEDDEILSSGFVLREIEHDLNDEHLFKEKEAFIKGHERFYAVAPSEEEYRLARDFEAVSKYTISFYDCLHLAICSKRRFILVTRDRKLLAFAKQYVFAEKPENLII